MFDLPMCILWSLCLNYTARHLVNWHLRPELTKFITIFAFLKPSGVEHLFDTLLSALAAPQRSARLWKVGRLAGELKIVSLKKSYFDIDFFMFCHCHSIWIHNFWSLRVQNVAKKLLKTAKAKVQNYKIEWNWTK